MALNLPGNIEDLISNSSDKEITVEMICSTTKAFVEKLPFSIDPLSEHFVPADLLNAIPADRLKYFDFKFEEVSLFDNLKSWRDTRKSAYAIQICYILQKMLCNLTNQGYTFDKAKLTEIWGLAENDSKIIIDTLTCLPKCSEDIKNADTATAREQALIAAYAFIEKNFGAWKPLADLDMYFYFHQLAFPAYKRSNNQLSDKDEKRLIKK